MNMINVERELLIGLHRDGLLEGLVLIRGEANDVITAIREIDPGLSLVALAGSPLLRWAQEQGLRVVAEAFADRAYTPAGALVSRREPGAVLHDADLIAERMLRLVCDGVIEAIDGSVVAIAADSICVHGDNPDAVAVAAQVRSRLTQAGVSIESFEVAAP